ncbi:fibronectin type III-like domain-contianing protein [Neobacillus vireti]|uniref:fibronectin type III-like domain-contianing protein n=1 Tax=Neobacillus vireti TaxID=220686 RepID=UPI002FFE96EA
MFNKTTLVRWETKEVTLELGAEELQVFSSQTTYKLEQGWFEIEVGNPVDFLSTVLTIG